MLKGTESITFDGASQGFSDGSHVRADGKITFAAPIIKIKLPTEIAGGEIAGLDADKTSIAAGSEIGDTYYKEAVISAAEKAAAEKAAAEQAAKEAQAKASAEQHAVYLRHLPQIAAQSEAPQAQPATAAAAYGAQAAAAADSSQSAAAEGDESDGSAVTFAD